MSAELRNWHIFYVGEAKSGVDFPPALLPLCDAAKVLERSYQTYSVTHQPSIVTLA
ncbi:hypothetical protein [Nostoc sp. UHCC 0870]|uniref:hypothetical protein n=1 Tax=Nostoc sp. UHCC 0870 TaxID=2914041 RepID=UPI0030DA30E2